PMCSICAVVGVSLRGMDNNILTQVGFVALVGLACKNAILIVEFARAAQETGPDRVSAVVEACRLRLRPILMTSFAFVLGVVPLLISKGPGSEMHQALGTSVFSGMLGVTFFGLLLTPVFYVVIRWFIERKHGKAERRHEKQPVAQATHIMLMLVLAPGLLGLVNGCKAVGPDYSEPAVPVTTAFANQERDFFGRVRRALEAGTADVGAEEASRRDVLVSLLAEVASNYFDLRGAQNQLAVARQNAATLQQTLEPTQALLAAGRGTELA